MASWEEISEILNPVWHQRSAELGIPFFRKHVLNMPQHCIMRPVSFFRSAIFIRGFVGVSITITLVLLRTHWHTESASVWAKVYSIPNDDVLTSLHTVDECARMLCAAGAATVYVTGVARGL